MNKPIQGFMLPVEAVKQVIAELRQESANREDWTEAHQAYEDAAVKVAQCFAQHGIFVTGEIKG